MSQDILRLIDSICRDKNIERDEFIADLENAMAGAIKKTYEDSQESLVKLDLLTGRISATVDGQPVEMGILGRIAAQAAKQMIIQKTRERERLSVFEEFTEKRGTIVTGVVSRVEGGNLIVNIGRVEGFLPRSEQIPGETHQPGNRLRVLVLEVRELPNQVKIILSRSHPEFVARLFEQEVPEVSERVIEIKALAREAGYRTKVAVSSIDSKVDAVGACVGVRGSRIRNIVDELGGEKIDIVRWNESSQILIQNALKPAEVQETALCFELGKATVVVAEDQLSLAIGKRGQNVRLAARLTGWDIDILTPAEYNKHLEIMETVLKAVEGVDEMLIDRMAAIGCVSAQDIDEIGPEPLVKELQIDADLAERIAEAAGEEVIRQEEEKEAAEKAKRAATAAGITTATNESPSGFVATESAPDFETAELAPIEGGAEVTPDAQTSEISDDAQNSSAEENATPT
ncbi:MAG: transcription termination factor NusA [Phycisphaerales bacterium]|nr:transcription termination factor NusA [Phycisphaerales bacterium]